MRKKVLFGVTALILVALVVPLVTACPAAPAPPAKDKIIFGQAVSLSGWNAIIHASYGKPFKEMWIDEINANGGLYIEDYGKRLPIELIVYDDKSDHGTTVKLMEKLILEDKVDFLLPPCGTSFLFAGAPIANKYEYILLGCEGGATSLEKVIDQMPYLFLSLSYSNHYQIPVLADILVECGVKTVAVTFNEDLHGIEYAGVTSTEFPTRGLNIVMWKSHPLGIADMSSILKEAKSLNADAFLGLGYPNEVILATKQALELGINFKLFQWNVGPCSAWYRDMFGADTVQGIVGMGAWNYKSTPGLKEVYDKFVARYGEGAMDFWGQGYYNGAYQFFQQAIEKAGTLDQKVIRDVMATETFETCLGPTWFDELHRMARECHPGEVGQWQNGLFEVIDPGARRTAPPIYPKPEWPSPE